MDGITEENFLTLCETLYDNISLKCAELDKGETNNDSTDYLILQSAIDIIDTSHGFIQTENNELRNVFNKVFREAGSIKNNTYRVSHNKRLMKDAENAKNDALLAQASEFFLISRKMLLSSYQRALSATKEAINIKNVNHL